MRSSRSLAARSATRTRRPPPPPDAHGPRRSARERSPAPRPGPRRARLPDPGADRGDLGRGPLARHALRRRAGRRHGARPAARRRGRRLGRASRARAARGRAVDPGAPARDGGSGRRGRAGEGRRRGTRRPRGHVGRGRRGSRRRARPPDRPREDGGRRLRAGPGAGAAPRARDGRGRARADPDAVAARLMASDGGAPTLPPLAPPAPPALPALDLPPLPEPPAGRLPGPLALEETSVTGAPRRLNSFDQNVPGFGVTFLLLGVLLGVSLGLLDEPDWGTLERVRSMPMSLATLLVTQLAARAAVGTVQMALLFAVGRLAFGVSLGPEPWALCLPTVGIVFAGTAFGLVVAATAPSREAVLPLGSIAIMTMAAVGGCWWPIDLEPDWMQRAALVFPTTWAMEAYNDLMIRRQPAGAALGATAVLLAHGGVYLAAGLLLFRRRVLRAA